MQIFSMSTVTQKATAFTEVSNTFLVDFIVSTVTQKATVFTGKVSNTLLADFKMNSILQHLERQFLHWYLSKSVNKR
jgi:hypothetical protein